jgi:hypothetical protein
LQILRFTASFWSLKEGVTVMVRDAAGRSWQQGLQSAFFFFFFFFFFSSFPFVLALCGVGSSTGAVTAALGVV